MTFPNWPIVPLDALKSDEPRAITDGPFGSNLTSAHYTEDGPRVVRLQNIGDGAFIDSPAHISESHFESLRQHGVVSGDLLVASLGELLPRACLAPDWLGPAIVKADCIRVRLSQGVNPKWVMYSMQRPEVRRWAERQLHGVGRQRLGLKVIRQIPVPLPDLQTQTRAVEILEDHLSRLGAGDRLLGSLSTKANAMVASALRHSLSQVGARDVSLRELLSIPLANGRSVPTRADGFPVLRLTALANGEVDLSQRKAGAWSSADADAFLVKQGDFLVSRGNGSLRLVGRGSLVTSEPDPVAFPDTMIRVRVNESLIRAPFLATVWNSRLVRRQIERMARTTAGIYKINQKQLQSVIIPVPEVSDQNDVLRSLESLTGVRHQLVMEAERATVRSLRLRQSLLTAAFSGRLTGRRTDVEIVEELAGV